jgi:hypothetical protein
LLSVLSVSLARPLCWQLVAYFDFAASHSMSCRGLSVHRFVSPPHLVALGRRSSSPPFPSRSCRLALVPSVGLAAALPWQPLGGVCKATGSDSQPAGKLRSTFFGLSNPEWLASRPV